MHGVQRETQRRSQLTEGIEESDGVGAARYRRQDGFAAAEHPVTANGGADSERAG